MSNARDLANIADDASDIVQGTAKAWVNFDGTTNTGGNCDIKSSYNVSSVGDDGTGEYTVNFSTAFGNTNYAPVCTSSAGTTQSANRCVSPVVFSTSSVTLRVRQTDNSVFRDNENVVVAVFS